MFRSVFFRHVTALALFGAFAVVSSAQTLVVNDPGVTGPAVTVTGTGAPNNGPVELFKGGVSQGYVFADGSGAFSFPNVSLSNGDQLQATASQAWYFNTDGDAQGWATVDVDDVVSVAGGVATITSGANANISFFLGGAVIAPRADVTRVLEIRMRHTGTGAPSGTVATIGNVGVDGNLGTGDDLFGFSQNFPALPANGSLRTFVIDLSRDNTGAATNWPNGTNGFAASQIGITLNGMVAGDTIEVDHVRLIEYIEFDWSTPGDLEGFTADANTNATVAGGNLTLTATANGVNTGVTGQFNWINSAYFNALEARLATTSSISPNLFFFNYFGGAGIVGSGYQIGYTADGSPQTILQDLNNAPAFGQAWGGGNVGSLNLGGSIGGLFANVAGENAVIDYVRIRTANPYGPSPIVLTTPVELSGFELE